MKRHSAPPRSIRRHQSEKRKRWVKKTLPHYFMWSGDFEPRRVGLYSETPKLCSCWMCGNPRKYFNEAPIQERRAPQFFLDYESI